MNAPPGNENGPVVGAALSDSSLASKQNVKQTAATCKQVALFPTNVERLRSLGIKFEWEKPEHILRLRCPLCSGRLLCDPEKPWHWHMGEKSCAVARMKFNDLLFHL